MTLYFAYGSNMNSATMTRRCPGARPIGPARPGYTELVAAAARAWKLPEPYIRSLERLRASRWIGARYVDVGDAA